VQLSLWKLVYWLWRYKLNEVFDKGPVLDSLKNWYWVLILQFKTYRVKSRKESCIRVNIKELNRVLFTKCLSYIHLANGSCYTNLVYSKETCVLYTIDIWYDIIILESFITFCVICDCMTMTWDCDLWHVTVTYNITLTSNPKFKNNK